MSLFVLVCVLLVCCGARFAEQDPQQGPRGVIDCRLLPRVASRQQQLTYSPPRPQLPFPFFSSSSASSKRFVTPHRHVHTLHMYAHTQEDWFQGKLWIRFKVHRGQSLYMLSLKTEMYCCVCVCVCVCVYPPQIEDWDRIFGSEQVPRTKSAKTLASLPIPTSTHHEPRPSEHHSGPAHTIEKRGGASLDSSPKLSTLTIPKGRSLTMFLH